MDTRIAPGGVRLDVIATDSASRVTPPSGVPFNEILAGGAGALLRGAQAAVTALPGAPIVAAALRPGAGPAVSSSPSTAIGMGLGLGAGGPVASVPGVSTPALTGTAESPVATGSGATNEQASIEGALAQSQQFNLYYLELQEQLSAENRSYSAMSNVLKARHDTIKNAIGNIR
jgi:hypothetical protein